MRQLSTQNQLWRMLLFYFLFIHFNFPFHNIYLMGSSQSKPKQRTQEQCKAYIQSLKTQIISVESSVWWLKQQLMKAQSEARKLKDPKLYRQLKEHAWTAFYENLAKCEFTSILEKQPGQRNHILIGNISAGKTSLINFTCKLELKVGLGETTTEAVKVCTSDAKVNIWDSPGANEDFSFYDIETLRLFFSMDRIFIVYCDSLKTCSEIIKSMFKIKPKETYLVRSMCDRGEVGQAKTIEEELKMDKSIIAGWKIELPVLATSAKRGMDYMDNKKFYTLLAQGNDK